MSLYHGVLTLQLIVVDKDKDLNSLVYLSINSSNRHNPTTLPFRTLHAWTAWSFSHCMDFANKLVQTIFA